MSKQFLLTKIKLKDGNSSMVDSGQFAQGICAIPDRENGVKYVTSVDEVVINEQVLVYSNPIHFIRTSVIKNISKVSDTEIEFETNTSVYSLKEITNESSN